MRDNLGLKSVSGDVVMDKGLTLLLGSCEGVDRDGGDMIYFSSYWISATCKICNLFKYFLGKGLN